MRWLILLMLPTAVSAEAVSSTRVIRAGTVIEAGDLQQTAAVVAGALTRIEDVAGLEARVILYPGRPILSDHVGRPALVQRNQIVVLSYALGGLAITTEGRSLARGGVGEVIPILNLASRATVSGQIQSDGTVRVGHLGN